MSSSAHPQPEPAGASSHDVAPRVVVRAEKYYLCTACGTLVEIPADVVGQLVLLAPTSKPTPPSNPTPSSQQLPPTEEEQEKPPGFAAAARPAARFHPTRRTNPQPVARPKDSRPPQPKRPRTPQQPQWAGVVIDGLPTPSGRQLDNALKWATFHLQVLDRQESEIKRLKKLLTQAAQAQPSCRRTRPPAQRPTRREVPLPTQRECEERVLEEVGTSPTAQSTHERGPP
ncbi:hypothetical protein Pan97_00800 [Bremerella volcania]|uniref:Uncharacterized protein n=1 Tax=Bremerella volcania TaxID=2527984 RepID=A0A518C1M3_9BACT|nr:hypothetical protein [Bremerella volcania]QDU73113.1 hypothetical protein Pan97_00800 [Bremerella volcania]